MLETQVYPRGYGDDVSHNARGVSPLSVRTPSDSENDQPSMSATHKEKLDYYTKQAAAGEKAVEAAKATHEAKKADPNATTQEKSTAENNLQAAEQSLAGHKADIEFHKSMIAEGHT